MDVRGRSPSMGQTNHHIRHSTSASPHPSPLDNRTSSSSSSFFDASNLGTASPPTDHSTTSYATGLNAAFTTDPTFTTDFSSHAHLGLEPSYHPGFSDQSQPQTRANNVSNHTFLQAQGLHDTNGTTTDTTNTSNAFPAFDTTFDSSLDPNVLDSFDPSQLDLVANPTTQSLDPMAAMAQSHSPTPPHLFADQVVGRPSASPSPHASPSFQHASYVQMNRPRINSESLDPSSARYPQNGSNEWQHIGTYRSHQRTPSDNYSDISSNHGASPNMPTLESFENSSPLLNPSAQDASFGNGLGFENFNLNEQQHFYSPGHSPGHSPHLIPQSQQMLPPFTADNNFGLNATMNGHFNAQQNGAMDMFPGLGQESLPAVHSEDQSPGMADHMSPPEINIDFAPPSRVPTENIGVEKSADALSPPIRSK